MLKYLDRLEEIIIAFLVGAATLIIFVAVLHRYTAGLNIPGLQDWLLGINLGWAQELCIYMFVWMAKFGAAYGVRTGIHVGVDVLVTRLPDTWRTKCVLLGISGGIFFTGTIGYLGGSFVWDNGMHYAVYNLLGLDVSNVIEGPVTPDLEWPTWIIYSAVPLGSFLMCFRFIQVGWKYFLTRELPQHDEGHVDGLEEETESIDSTDKTESGAAKNIDHETGGGGAK